MTVRDLREKYLRFFESKGHLRFPAGSLVPYDVTGRLDESLLLNGAGMVQFKPYFRGIAKPENPRLTTCQPCARTGDIEEVGDDTHLSFFEMLGNFSFGDYFKPQAIAFSWEFITGAEWLNLDPKRVSFTVFEEDQEAYDEWAFWITPTGIDPATRVFKLGEDTNYWPAGAFSGGPPGPCGPNSEMFYWTADEEPPSGSYTREDWLRDEGQGKWVEFWNDVFIQYEWQGHLKDASNPKAGYVKDAMPDLPFRSIDTGMGLERTALVLGGYHSVWEIDVFQPILARVRNVAAKSEERAERVVADHVRTAVFCIADGILPGNTGRGYVLRRLIRRAILQGRRRLGIDRPFLEQVFEGVVEAMGMHYTSLHDRRETIVETLRGEENLFRRTLDRGVDMLYEEVEKLFINSIAKAFASAYRQHRDVDISLSPNLRQIIDSDPTTSAAPISEEDVDYLVSGFPDDLEGYGALIREIRGHMDRMPAGETPVDFVLPGSDAFRLYDTYGFPLEVTQELAEELGLEVDMAGYEQALHEAQARSRGGQERESVYGGVTADQELVLPESPETTAFLGYICGDADARIVRVSQTGGHLRVALDRTPFYAASGGQIGDHGTLTLGDGTVLSVANTTKASDIFWHNIEDQPDLSGADLLGKTVIAKVLGSRRARIQRNHTATHLLQAALREVLGAHVTQAGSYVGPDNLRFDFTHGKALSPEEMERVERRVNEEVLANTEVNTYVDLPIEEAKAKGAMALFGEKYGNVVRMVEIGNFSRELCGGTHVRSTGEVGLFKVISESSAASGVRRIEALTGEGAYDWVREETARLREAANLLKTSPRELVPAIERVLEGAREERKRREKAEMAAMGGGPAAATNDSIEIGPVILWRRTFGDVDPKLAATTVDNIAASAAPNQVTLAAAVSNGKPQFFCKVGPAAITAGAHAGNLLREIAKIAGGGGGGRPDFATAGGKDPSKVDEAMIAAAKLLAGMVGVSPD